LQVQLKFNPSLSRVLAPGDRRLWLLRSVALRIENRANPLWVFEVYHRRLCIALGSLAFAGWLLAVSGLYFWLDRQPHNQVGWFDLAAPWRWSGLRAQRGDTAILTGLDQLKSRDYTSAYYNLRVGLSRSPGNVEGRIALARLLVGQDPARAVALLEEGLPSAAGDATLVGTLLSAYGRFRMHSRGLAVIEEQLRGTPPPDTQRILRRARVDFLCELGRSEEAVRANAERTVAGESLRPDEVLAEAELAVKLQQPAEARKRLAPLLENPATPPATWLKAVEVAVALGDADGVTSGLRRLRAAAPNDPGPYLIAYRAWHQLKRASLRDGTEQEYFRLFRGNDGAMQAFAAQAVLLDLPEALVRAQQAARSARLSPFAFWVHRTELALRQGDVEGATRLLREWENGVDTLTAAQRFHPEFIKRLARAAFAGTPDQVSFLLAHLAAARGLAPLASFQLAASVLESSGNPAGAVEVARAGLQVYPGSDPLEAVQDRLAAATAVAAARGADVPKAVPLAIAASAADVRRRVAELAEQDSLGALRDLIRGVRAQNPPWLPTVDAELGAREVEIACRTLDEIGSRAAVRGYLDTHRDEAELLTLITVVPRLTARGHEREARLIVDEIQAFAVPNPRVQQALRETNLLRAEPAVLTAAETLASLDRQISALQWTEAERMLKRLRDNPPEWAPAAATDLRVREVQVRLGLGQRPLALAALKEITIKSGAPRSAAFKLVRDLVARGEGDSAVLLAREIARLLPGDPAAARLLQEAETPRPDIP
jgi:hypothetical protein